MDIKPLDELQAPDKTSLQFGPWGLGSPLKPEDAARFQQEQVADLDLVPAVAQATRAAFDRLRLVHAHGVLLYDLYTLVADQGYLMRERALRDRFMQWCAGSLTFENPAGQAPPRTEPVHSYDDVHDLLKRLGDRRRPGEKWRLRVGPGLVDFNGTLGGLHQWARAAGLLRGQRARTAEKPWTNLRNHVAHGSTGTNMPVESARALRDLAEFINQLWGSPTPGGRLYPAPIPRTVAALSWSSTGSRTVWTAEALRDPHYTDDDGDTFILVRAVATHGTFPEDRHLLDFDARFETTTYPADYLWGPGSRAEALAWLEDHPPADDSTDPVDRILLLREHNGIVYLPMRPQAAAGIATHHRPGRWHAVRADYPSDAYAHVRSAADSSAHRTRPGRDCPTQGCPVHLLGSGNYHQALNAAASAVGPITPALPPPVRVPPLAPLPNRF